MFNQLSVDSSMKKICSDRHHTRVLRREIQALRNSIHQTFYAIDPAHEYDEIRAGTALDSSRALGIGRGICNDPFDQTKRANAIVR